jgi:hypothetical protein
MGKIPFCAFLISVGYFFVPLTQAQTMTARVPMSEAEGKEIVQVSINGAGPYDFILDTGAYVTLVKPQLFRKLNMSGGKPVSVVTTLGTIQQQRATAQSVAIAGLSVEHLEINTLEGVQFGPLEGRVQGILGENFLMNFDLLIDNEHQTLILDRTSSLADTLAGEHLQLSRFGTFNNAPTPGRIVVQLTVPSFLQKPLLFLVDSGTNAAVLYPAPGGLALRAMQSSQHGELRDLNDSRDCVFQTTTLKLGSGTFRGINLVACEGMTRNKMDVDGLLPTHAFHQFFISHSGGYVIANPHPVAGAGELAGQAGESKQH